MRPVGERELFAIEFLKCKLARNRPRHNAVDCPRVDQKLDLDRAPARPARVGDFRGDECNSYFILVGRSGLEPETR